MSIPHPGDVYRRAHPKTGGVALYWIEDAHRAVRLCAGAPVAHPSACIDEHCTRVASGLSRAEAEARFGSVPF